MSVVFTLSACACLRLSVRQNRLLLYEAMQCPDGKRRDTEVVSARSTGQIREILSRYDTIPEAGLKAVAERH